MRRLLLWILMLLLLAAVGVSVAVRFLTAEQKVVDPSGLRVEVLNGCRVPRLGRAVADELQLRRFDVRRVGNVDSTYGETTLVERVDPSGSHARKIADYLGVEHRLFGLQLSSKRIPAVAVELDSSRYVDVSIIIGADYQVFLPEAVPLH
jgi:hypothetical protein